MIRRICVICGRRFKVQRHDSPVETCGRRCGSTKSMRRRDPPPPPAYQAIIAERVERFAALAARGEPLFA